MSKLAWFMVGGLSLAIVLAVVSLVALRQAHGFSALETPSGIERWIAGTARDFAMPSAAKSAVNPIPDSPEVLTEARAHWADHCASATPTTAAGTRKWENIPILRHRICGLRRRKTRPTANCFSSFRTASECPAAWLGRSRP